MITYEEIKCNDSIIRGMCHSGDTYENCPIIIVHGYFSANRIGPQRLFVNISNFLSKNNYFVYRFDLRGMGESDGDISEIKFSDHVQDLKAIIDFVKKRHENKKVIVIAHCLGCNITLSVVNSNPEIFREIIFLAPFYSNQIILEKFFGVEKLKELAESKFTYRKGLYSDYSFFAENKQADFKQKIIATPVTINVILPLKDQFIPIECNIETFNQVEKANIINLSNSDHNFLETQNELKDLILRLIQDEKFTI